MSIDRPTLAEFVRHAERYGTELVYDTATEGYLSWDELADLSLALQRIDKHWKLSRDQQARLAAQLDQVGTPDAEICAAAQLSRVTLYRLRQQQQATPNSVETPLKSAQPCGGNVSKRPSPMVHATQPKVKHAGR